MTKETVHSRSGGQPGENTCATGVAVAVVFATWAELRVNKRS